MNTQEDLTNPTYGWVMAAVVFILTGLSFGVLGSAGVFMKPLAAEFGWSRGSLSLGYTAVTLATAASTVIWGILADRHGTRWITMFSAPVLGVSLLLLSRIDSLWEFYAYHLLFGALGHGALTGPLYANVSLWFRRNIGLAIGITISGGAVGQGVVPMIARLLISEYGWSDTYAILGTGYLIIAIPVALLVRNPPRREGSDGSETPPMRDGRPFPLPPLVVVSWIALAVIFCCITMSVPIVHLVPLLTDRGIGPQTAVSALLVLMMAGALGRILGGRLADQIGPLQAYISMSLAQTVAVFFFPIVGGMASIYALAVVFGLFYSGVMASFVVIMRFMVPANYLARSMAVVIMTGWIGMGIGGWQGGAVFDLTGDYVWSFGIASIAGFINVGILMMFYLHIRRAAARGLAPQLAA
ncbi:MAG: MFS transporter [Rhodospirillales bacterium]|jgi:MFS family permease|nr:MFS transporter [Rhodospirillales bacterium]MDP6644262.1 MFS transporter [Rhodospirillales bacterium]MDP6843484.1 MFS transporter [Rhodospirillales bacterium]|tara:strand:+ start:218 stop:1456 length:1239 start_codon:yes stop_codon:yes gene_type:complete